MYIKSVDGFSGDGNFMSKFGLEIRDQVVFSVAQRVFSEEIGNENGFTRPREGDIVFFPLNNKCFQIKYVNKFEMFYQLGGLQTWELTCELFEYSDEDFDTGIYEIDALQTRQSTNILDFSITDENGLYLQDEDGNYLVTEKYRNTSEVLGTGTNDIIHDAAGNMLDWSVHDPFSEGNF